jgi:hypothetical protein
VLAPGVPLTFCTASQPPRVTSLVQLACSQRHHRLCSVRLAGPEVGSLVDGRGKPLEAKW